MSIIFAIIGGVVGAILGAASGGSLGLVLGAIIGVLLTRQNAFTRAISKLVDRIERLEATARLATKIEVSSPAKLPAAEPVFPAHEPKPEPTPTFEPSTEPNSPHVRAAMEMPSPAEHFDPRDTAVQQPARPVMPKPSIPAHPNLAEKLASACKNWLTSGNVPVKAGVIVSFFGISFLLKYAVDIGMLYMPIAVRYLLVALVGVAIFVFGWRLREKMRVYALSMQGGGIGVVYLTIFAAFRLQEILPANVAFMLLIILTAAIGMLAVAQDAVALAVLGTVGGFIAPILIATGSGNHVTLFGYYLVLNCAVLYIAWFKSWRWLNIIGFLFTFGVGMIWGGQYYRPEYFGSTEPFLIAFFLFYHAIAILFAFRQPPDLRGLVDGTLIFGTPGIVLLLQSQLVADIEYGLAYSCAAAAAMYATTAFFIYRLKLEQMRLLVESYFSLAVVFGTIAIPLALDERFTVVAWALEGAALIWVGVRQSRFLSKISGTLLLYGSGYYYFDAGWSSGLGMPILNGNVMSGVLIALLSLLSAHRLAVDRKQHSWQQTASIALLLWGLIWWFGIGTGEIQDRLAGTNELHATAVFIAISSSILAFVAAALRWKDAQATTVAYLPAMFALALAYFAEFSHLFAGISALVWLVVIASHFLVMRTFGEFKARFDVTHVWHYAGGMLIALAMAQEVGWRIGQAIHTAGNVWAGSGTMFVMTALALAISYSRKFVVWPLQQHATAYASVAITLVGLQLTVLTLAGLDHPGTPALMAYVPLFNPYDFLTVFGLAVALYGLQPGKLMSRWLEEEKLRLAKYGWGAVAFFLTTIAVVRAVHHLGGVPWSQNALSNSVTVQSSLTIYWAILGLGSMIVGVRRVNRHQWMIGAGLMLLVVVKLWLVDMGNSGTLARIISFLGVGMMLLVVGYFAPAPPKQVTDESVTEDT